MAFTRDKQTGGGGFKRDKQEPGIMGRVGDFISGSYNNLTDLDQWKRALTESPEAKSVMNPQQSIPDLARSMGNFTSLGLTDRLRTGLYGTDIANEVRQSNEASSRLGSIDEAANLGTALVTPGLAAKATVPFGAAGKAGLYGAEGAGQAGAQSVIEGQSPEDILKSMAAGGAFGAGGSALGDVAGAAANKMFYGKPIQDLPTFQKPMDLVNAGTQAKLNTREGKDTYRRANIMKDFLKAETKGPAGFQKMDEDIQKRGAKSMGLPFEFEESVSKLAQPKGSWKQSAANVLDFGGGWGKLAASKVLGGAPVLGAAGLRFAEDMGGKLDKKTLMKAKSMLLQGTTRGVNPDMTPEMRDELRSYLAKMSMGAARTRQQGE